VSETGWLGQAVALDAAQNQVTGNVEVYPVAN
jgi:hypothetical protein